MNKISQILNVIGIVFFVFIAFSLSGTQSQPVEDMDRMIIDYIDSIQLNPNENYIYELESIISENQSEPYARHLRERVINRSEPYVPYLREKAIFALTDIAIRKNQSDEIVGFLKNTAINEQSDTVRNAAYANIDLIRRMYPLKKFDSMNLTVSGKVQKGENISIIAKISSTAPIHDAVIGINRLHENIEILSNPIVKIHISGNESRLVNESVEFKLRLKEAGRYKIPISLLTSLDRVDYNNIYKSIYLNVSPTSLTSYDAVHIEG